MTLNCIQITLALLVIDYICKLEMLLINVLIFILNYRFEVESSGANFLAILFANLSYQPPLRNVPFILIYF